jgi:acetylornithine/N-succinyldiaminopimelate aminotransferase
VSYRTTLNIGQPSAADVMATEAEHVLQTYKRLQVVFVRGKGPFLYSAEGHEYLDFLSGIGVVALGHSHPGLAEAIADQAATLMHTSNLFFHPLQGQLAERLAALSGLSRAFICNSGTEAVEACLKLARRYWFTQGVKDRTEYVALEHSFAGRTFGSLSVTWDPHYRDPFQPLVPGVTFVSPKDPAALTAAVTDRTAAIIAEPIQGEGGVRPLSPEFAAAIGAACAKTGALYIADEVQCGLGRTGEAFHFSSLGLTPDLISVGKALGGGFPVGAAIVSDKVAKAVSFGDHGTTYGGNPLACRAALYVLDQLQGDLLPHVRRVGAYFEEGLRDIAAKRPGQIAEIRGKGLMWGVDLGRDAAPVMQAALTRGLVVNRTSESVIRLLPPYIVSEAEIDRGLSILEAALSDVLGTPGEARNSQGA